jgi:hypothetical protein
MIDKSGFISSKILQRIHQAPISMVWTPVDFLDFGSRDAVERALQRMVVKHELRRIDRGLYDQIRFNSPTDLPASLDYHMVIDAVGRRDQLRLLIDGMTAANDLGLTNAVPGKVIVHTDARLRSIKLDHLTLQFKLTAPSKLYWAGRPAMRIVQSLYWLRDSLKSGSLLDEHIIQNKIIRLLQDPNQGAQIQEELILGLHTVPSWMQDWIRNMLAQTKLDSSEE